MGEISKNVGIDHRTAILSERVFGKSAIFLLLLGTCDDPIKVLIFGLYEMTAKTFKCSVIKGFRRWLITY